jgi:hypothetical protein
MGTKTKGRPVRVPASKFPVKLPRPSIPIKLPIEPGIVPILPFKRPGKTGIVPLPPPIKEPGSGGA